MQRTDDPFTSTILSSLAQSLMKKRWAPEKYPTYLPLPFFIYLCYSNSKIKRKQTKNKNKKTKTSIWIHLKACELAPGMYLKFLLYVYTGVSCHYQVRAFTNVQNRFNYKLLHFPRDSVKTANATQTGLSEEGP